MTRKYLPPMIRNLAAATAASLLLLTVPQLAGGALPESATLTASRLGKVKLRMTERQVEKALGRGIKLDDLYGDGSCATAAFGHRSYLIFSGGRVRRITLTTKFWATKSGLRVGMPESAVKDEYGSKAKRSKHAYTDGSYLKVTRGNRRLVFETDGEKITTIHGGRKPEVDYIEACA